MKQSKDRPKDRMFEDLAQLAGGTVNMLTGLTRQIKEDIRSRVDELAVTLDLVPRADFERLEAMVIKLREEQEKLKAQLKGKKPAPAPRSKKARPKAKK